MGWSISTLFGFSYFPVILQLSYGGDTRPCQKEGFPVQSFQLCYIFLQLEGYP